MTHEVDKLADGAAALDPPTPRAPGDASSSSSLTWLHGWVAILSGAAVLSLILTLAVPHHAHGVLPSLGLLVCFAAAWSDSATGRIPNLLNYPAILLGLLLSMAMLIPPDSPLSLLPQWIGGPQPLDSLTGFAVCAVGGVICVLLNGIGAGDMKLIAAMGAIFGLHTVAIMLLWALCVAIPMAVLNLLFDRKLIAFFHAAGLQLMTWFTLGSRGENIMNISKRRMPIAVPLLVGAVLGFAVPEAALPVWLSGVTG